MTTRAIPFARYLDAAMTESTLAKNERTMNANKPITKVVPQTAPVVLPKSSATQHHPRTVQINNGEF